jgi:hypothetical protein
LQGVGDHLHALAEHRLSVTHQRRVFRQRFVAGEAYLDVELRILLRHCREEEDEPSAGLEEVARQEDEVNGEA